MLEQTLKKNADFVTKTAPSNKFKEMKAFNSVCKSYKLGKEDEYVIKLCNERIKIYVYNDNTSERIRQYLVLCDTVIKTVEFNRDIMKQLQSDVS